MAKIRKSDFEQSNIMVCYLFVQFRKVSYIIRNGWFLLYFVLVVQNQPTSVGTRIYILCVILLRIRETISSSRLAQTYDFRTQIQLKNNVCIIVCVIVMPIALIPILCYSSGNQRSEDDVNDGRTAESTAALKDSHSRIVHR